MVKSTKALCLEARSVTKRFGATLALDRVDLSVGRGEVLALVGENGAGKSTLMKVLSGALSADEGELRLMGEAYAPQSPWQGRQAGVSMIYQELSLAGHLTAAENILLGVEPKRGPLLDRREQQRIAASALAEVGLDPKVIADSLVSRLTPAQRQLVEIARAVASGCHLLVLDEPTSSLGAHDVERLFVLIERIRERGTAVIYISHMLEEVRRIADRFVCLRDGQTVGGGDPRQVDEQDVIAMMVGREVKELYPTRSTATPGEVALRVDALSGPGFDRVSLDLHHGEILGLAGLVGAGRTEFLRCLFGLEPAESGTSTMRSEMNGVVQAEVMGPSEPWTAWRSGMGLVSEDRKQEGLAQALSIAENLCLPDQGRLARSGWLGRLGWLSSSKRTEHARSWVERLRIQCAHVDQPIGALSGGNQQKVALARLYFADVDVLLLDEPTRGIDVGSKAEIYGWLRGLTDPGDSSQIAGKKPRHKPKAVLLVSSYLPELFGLCDRIGVFAKGRLVETRSTEEWTEAEVLRVASQVDPPKAATQGHS